SIERTISSTSSPSCSSGMPLDARRLRLLDDLLGDVRRHLLVVRELEREVAAAAGHRAEVRRVAQHLRHRHVRLDHLLAVALRLDAEHLAAAAVQVADHVAHALVGHDHVHGHDRLEQHGLAHLVCRLLLEKKKQMNPAKKTTIANITYDMCPNFLAANLWI